MQKKHKNCLPKVSPSLRRNLGSDGPSRYIISFLVTHGAAVNRTVATIPDECFLEDYGMQQSTQTVCNGVYDEASCIAACVYDQWCFEYLWREDNICAKTKKTFFPGGGYTMLNIVNPACQMFEECHVREFNVCYFRTGKSLTTGDARECHAECAMFPGCKFWQWKDNLCELMEDYYCKDITEEPYWYFGSRTCKV